MPDQQEQEVENNAVRQNNKFKNKLKNNAVNNTNIEIFQQSSIAQEAFYTFIAHLEISFYF